MHWCKTNVIAVTFSIDNGQLQRIFKMLLLTKLMASLMPEKGFQCYNMLHKN